MRNGVCGAVCRPACGAGEDPENKQPLPREPPSRPASESPPLRAPPTPKVRPRACRGPRCGGRGRRVGSREAAMAAALRPAPLLRQAGNGPPPPGPGLRPAAGRPPALPAARDAGPPQSGRRAQATASPRTRPRVLGAEAGAPGSRNVGRGWIWRERARRGPCVGEGPGAAGGTGAGPGAGHVPGAVWA